MTDISWPTCVAEDCDKPPKARGWCNAHYVAWWRRPDRGATGVVRDTCSVAGCDRKHEARGWCRLHYTHWYRTGDPLKVRPTVPPALHGERHPCWTGGEATYQAVHKRLRKERGPASAQVCQGCGVQSADWAYTHNDPDEKCEGDLLYSTDLTMYVPLCRPCHRRLDSNKGALHESA